MNFFLKPFTSLFSAAVLLRNILFDQNFFKAIKISKPVISIGNLTVGGTGKTPFTIFLIQLLEQKKKRVGVVARGYGAHIKNITEVLVTSSAQTVGDEPLMIKESSPNTTVYVGKEKYNTALKLVKDHDLDIVLVDDGFQHRFLQRDMDLVLLDTSCAKETYDLLPSGRAREGFMSLDRASAVILTKINFADSETLKLIYSALKAFPKLPVFELKQTISKLYDLKTLSEKQLAFQSSVALLSGIAQPQVFEKMVKETFNLKIVEHYKFSDHHLYTEEEIKNIAQDLKLKGIKTLIVTEKDKVKLTQLRNLQEAVSSGALFTSDSLLVSKEDLQILVAKLTLDFAEQKNKFENWFYESISIFH